MIYKIKDEDLVIFEEDLLGNKGDKVAVIALEHIGLIEFSKVDLKAVKAVLVNKDKLDALASLMKV